MANNLPIYGGTPDPQVGGAGLGVTAVTALDGSGTLTLLYQADATNGSWVEAVTLKPIGSPAATVVRLFLCTAIGAFTSGTTNTTTNTALIPGETTLGVVTVSNAQAQSDIVIPVRRQLAPGQKILIAFGTSTGVAGNAYAVVAWAAKY